MNEEERFVCARRRWLRGLCLLGRLMGPPVKPEGSRVYVFPLSLRLDRAIHRRCGNLRHTGKRNTTMYLTAVPLHPHPVLRIDLSPIYLIWGRSDLASPLPLREREGPAAKAVGG